jgi:wyosine [tRNA(Phe)-imidazoG37] synthetase (radical SAM superfamily)
MNIINYKYVKEIRKNPTLGELLPVDFNPFKVCSFNCIYCPEGETTRFLMERELFYPPKEIFDEIQHYINNNEKPDYAWLTGCGEPTLYSGFAYLASLIKENYPEMKIGVYSNGSLLHQQDVRDDFSLCDLFFVNVNSLNFEEHLKISRHHKDVSVNNLMKGVKLFRQQFKGELGISTYFVKGINNKESTLKQLKSFLIDIKPDIYMISEFSNEKYPALSEEFKENIRKTFSDTSFEVMYRFS